MPQSPRPKAVTYLLVFVLTFTGWHALRLLSSLQNWSVLLQLPLNVSPHYLALSGLLWAALGLIATWGMLTVQKWLPAFLKTGSLAYVLLRFADKAFLQPGGLGQADWPFELAAAALLIFLIFWALSIASTRAYFGVHDE